MKRQWKKHITLFIGIIFLIYGCSGDDKKDAATNTQSSFLTATINGDAFSSSLEVVTFKAGGKTYLTTADNKSGVHEYEFQWIIEDTKSNDSSKIRYGFIELKDKGGDRKKNKMWALPKNFDFTTMSPSNGTIEGTFSFTANSVGRGMVEDSSDQLKVTNGKYRANIKGGY
jgi:hypothetical protein